MSAITGYLSFSGGVRLDELRQWCSAAAQAMSVRARGPIAVWADPSAGIAMGCKASGDAPAGGCLVSDRHVLVFDGEAFDALEPAPPPGASGADRFLATVERWGIDAALPRLAGGFAFALWDRRERTLYAGCDRFSERSLYCSTRPHSFVFGSMLGALRRYPGWQGEIDRNALALLLRHTYIPYPHAIYRGVRKLGPATLLALNGDGPQPREDVYWTLSQPADDGFRGTRAEAVEELDRRIRIAVRRRAAGEPAAGVYLSGGIDSSTIAAVAQSESAGAIATFTAGFEEASYDEAPHARAVAAHLGTAHTEIYVTAAQVADLLPRLPDIYDEPFADSSQVPSAIVARAARQSVDTVLCGDGGDELFSDQRQHRPVWDLGTRAAQAPMLLRRAAAFLLRCLERAGPPVFGRRSSAWLQRRGIEGPFGQQIETLAALLPMRAPESWYAWLASEWHDSEMPVLSTGLAAHLFRPSPCQCASDYLEAIRQFEALYQLPGDFLVKVDRATASAGLRSRMPYLDPAVFPFVWHLPGAVKYGPCAANKALLREVLYRHVPRPLVDRPKQGFSIPLGRLFKTRLRDWAESLLDERRLRTEGFFDWRLIRRAWCEHLADQADREDSLWVVLMFQAWLAKSREP